jgi:hypothetical protein
VPCCVAGCVCLLLFEIRLFCVLRTNGPACFKLVLSQSSSTSTATASTLKANAVAAKGTKSMMSFFGKI